VTDHHKREMDRENKSHCIRIYSARGGPIMNRNVFFCLLTAVSGAASASCSSSDDKGMAAAPCSSQDASSPEPEAATPEPEAATPEASTPEAGEAGVLGPMIDPNAVATATG